MHSAKWKVAGRTLDVSRDGLIMGVLNVTPDSFSDGGAHFAREDAVEHGIKMAAEGADIIDVGGESTKPDAEPVETKEELRRTIPVIEGLHQQIDALISIDTSKGVVARAAIQAGASIVNDVTGGRGDPELLDVVAETNAALVIMHMQGMPKTMQIAPQYDDVVAEVTNFFLQQYDCALQCGIDPMAIAFDPGIGFGKTLAHNLELLRNLERLRVHDRPIVVGVSRKSFLGKLIGSKHMTDRMAPTVALTALLRAHGANIFRVHDVKENANALRVVEAMLKK